MSFIGAIAAPLRKILAHYAKEVDLPVLLPCGGNFTMGSALRSGGYKGRITACDITLYSCALGSYLAGDNLKASERSDCPEHLAGLLDTSDPARLAASISLLLDLYQVWKNRNFWHKRVLASRRNSWPQLMEKTVAKLASFKTHMTAGAGFGFAAQDALEFLSVQDRDQALLIAPPTYGTKGYVKLDEVLSACTDWQAPKFGEINFDSREIYEVLTSFRQWFIIMEKTFPEIESLLGKPVAAVHRGRNSVCYAYASKSKKTWVTRVYRDSASPGPIFPSEREITGTEEPGLLLLTHKQTVRLSELFMSSRVDYSQASFLLSVGFCLDKLLIGKADFKISTTPWKLPEPGLQIYQLSDLAVPSAKVSRLAKLVLLFIQSNELKFLLNEKLPGDWRYTITTAFCSHPVSMKYRGIYTLYKRLAGDGQDKYRLNYYAPLGQASLAESFAKWLKKFHKYAK